MFLGISWLATTPPTAGSERGTTSRSTVFGHASVGFYVVQVFTALILILAANTAYQDSPRLASILARDLPAEPIREPGRPPRLERVIVLAVLCLMIYAFDAELSTVISFYVVRRLHLAHAVAGGDGTTGWPNEGRANTPSRAARR